MARSGACHEGDTAGAAIQAPWVAPARAENIVYCCVQVYGPGGRAAKMAEQGGAARAPIRFYTEDELDAIEEVDPDRAFRIARAQAMAERGRQLDRDPEAHPPPDRASVEDAIADVRQILAQDGGDIELVSIEGREVRVRMKGACTGCPNAPLDLKNVVERVVFNAVPGVSRISNTF